MDANWMIPAFVVIDTLMERLKHRRDGRAHVPDSEILTTAGVAARYFGRHHERAVQIMHGCGYRSGRFNVWRFHRRLHHAPMGWPGFRRGWGRCSPRATCSSSRSFPCRCAAGCAPGAVERCAGAHSTGVVAAQLTALRLPYVFHEYGQPQAKTRAVVSGRRKIRKTTGVVSCQVVIGIGVLSHKYVALVPEAKL